MSKMIPMALMMVMPVAGMAQNKSGLKAENFDKTVKPQDDFYMFATGGWQKLNPLPAAYSRFGSFDQLQEDNNKRINAILGDLQKKTFAEGSTERKLSDFYKLAMDSVRRNQEGIAPVKPLLDEMEAARTKADLQKLQLKYAPMGYGVPFGSGFGADEKNVTENILNVSQGGLTLGQRDYYLNNDEATVKIREAYREHIARMFQLFGFTKAQAEAKRDAVFRFETSVALISKSRTELRDPQANYNKMTLDEMKALCPNIPFEEMANAEGVKSEYIQQMVVGQPKFMEGIDKLLTAMTADDLRAYMEWDVISGAAGMLSDEIREANFDFFGRTMTGRQQDYPLWRRATNAVQGAMGEALGKMYCDRYFPATSKKQMETLVHNLQVALGERIDAQKWMSDSTKQNAHKKLNTFYVKIGYPNKWRDYSKLDIKNDSYYANVVRSNEFDMEYMFSKINKPVDKDEWLMTPQTVNAYYNPTTNEICFPAAILQPPFFNMQADEATNYGAIGVVIGHELTHGFDDQGRQYDKDGNLNDWWTEADAKNFDNNKQALVDAFSAVKVLEDGGNGQPLYGNGQLTLGENIADNGGLHVSYLAMQNAMQQGQVNKEKMDNFTPEQRFFLAYAAVWASNINDEGILNLTQNDVHSLGRNRVNVALPQITEFIEAFGIKEGDGMWLAPEKRAQLW